MKKKIYKTLFILSLPLLAVLAINFYYRSLPIQGAYETRQVSYPTIDQALLKSQLSSCSTLELEDMRLSGLEILKWQQLLKKVNTTVMGDVIRDQPLFIGNRYPQDEVVDFDSHSSYFYHSHRPEEHGHFHIYYSDEDQMDQYSSFACWDSEHINMHIAAISMHPDGEPIGLFAPNHWISKDKLYKAPDMLEMISQFEISHPYPSWPSNQWVNYMLKLFRPQLVELLQKRDQRLFESGKATDQILKDEKIDVLSSVSISIKDQMEMIDILLRERKQGKNHLIEEK